MSGAKRCCRKSDKKSNRKRRSGQQMIEMVRRRGRSTLVSYRGRKQDRHVTSMLSTDTNIKTFEAVCEKAQTLNETESKTFSDTKY